MSMNRDQLFNVRVNSEDRAIFTNVAKRLDISQSDAIRKAMRGLGETLDCIPRTQDGTQASTEDVSGTRKQAA
jgi:hypothetical protein